ncbi:hypothetical protein D3C86_1579440 [compost metagenome]
MLQHQRVPLTAAGGGQQHRRIDQRVHPDQIEQMLEVARERATVDRRGGDQQVCRFDVRQLCLDLRRQFLARQRAAQRAGNLAQVHDAGVEHEPFFQRPEQCLHQHPRARGLMDTAIDGDDFEGCDHWCTSVWIDPYLSAVAAEGERRNSSMDR